MSRWFLARVAYDGTHFSGYQIQRRDRTVQGELERALEALHGHPIKTAVAGRTDAGVHADGQYVSFESDHGGIPTENMAAAINSHLPGDVAVLSVRAVPSGFHARYNARSRHYRYYLLHAPVQMPHLRSIRWRVPQALDVSRVNRDAAAVVGEHDFTTFAARRELGDSMVRRVLYASLERSGAEYTFSIGADGFLWRMVRSIVGTVVERELQRQRGTPPESTMTELLGQRDRRRAGTTAPAWGLFLHHVEYDL